MTIPKLPVLVYQRNAIRQGGRLIWLDKLLLSKGFRIWFSNDHEGIHVDHELDRSNRDSHFPYNLIVVYVDPRGSEDRQYGLWLVRQLCASHCRKPCLVVTSDAGDFAKSAPDWDLPAPVDVTTGIYQPISDQSEFQLYMLQEPVRPEAFSRTVGKILLHQ